MKYATLCPSVTTSNVIGRMTQPQVWSKSHVAGPYTISCYTNYSFLLHRYKSFQKRCIWFQVCTAGSRERSKEARTKPQQKDRESDSKRDDTAASFDRRSKEAQHVTQGAFHCTGCVPHLRSVRLACVPALYPDETYQQRWYCKCNKAVQYPYAQRLRY